MTGRASIFDGDDDLDVAGFAPAAAAPKRDPAELAAVRETAERKGFSSREIPAATPAQPRPAAAPDTPALSPAMPQESRVRRRRTGRDRQINIKTSDAVVDQFYALADANGWGLGETFEKALQALLAQQGAR